MYRPIRFTVLALLGFLPMLSAHADQARFEVTVTNITHGQQFTPLLLVTHRPDIALFELGQPASSELATLAEEGNVAPLRAVLAASASVAATEAGATLTNPGASATFTIHTRRGFDRISIAAMLIPTNDAFLALDGFDLDAVPRGGSRTAEVFVPAYDAGSERNDELCASIPGPNFTECGGPGGGKPVGGGEGFVHIHNGIHGVGNLNRAVRTWQNPVARITIRRLR